MSMTTASSNPISNELTAAIAGTNDDQQQQVPLLSSSLTSPSVASAANATDNKNNNSCNTNPTENMQDSDKGSGNSLTMNNNMSRKDLIGDCALVEIIHLHDCLRGALNALEKDLTELSKMVLNQVGRNNGASHAGSTNAVATKSAEEAQLEQLQQHHQSIGKLESRATARFQVIWSVFRAHSAAEDEFIWPTLRSKTQGLVTGSPCGSPCYQPVQHPYPENKNSTTSPSNASNGYESSCGDDEVVEQEEYEEDHADEERMFTMMDHLLTRLHKGLVQLQQRNNNPRNGLSNHSSSSSYKNGLKKNIASITNTTKEILSLVKTLNQHLMVHLEKEEKQCLPLVVKHLSKSEIHDLVGKIMGKRSSNMIAQILSMAVQNLKEADREEMVKHMKQAMVGTFFDKWLSMTGWNGNGIVGNANRKTGENDQQLGTRKRSASIAELSITSTSSQGAIDSDANHKRQMLQSGATVASSTSNINDDAAATSSSGPAATAIASSLSQSINNGREGEITNQESLEKLIRAVVTNSSMTPTEKNTTIQGLRASVWKRNQQLMGKVSGTETTNKKNNNNKEGENLDFPTAYYQRDANGIIVPVWKPSNVDSTNLINDKLVPKFTASELAPTYNDGTTTGHVLGCHHYARACKLRHPVNGKLYTCRLCAEQEREASATTSATNDKDNVPLDRYSVTEVSCMKCNVLQPAAKTCINVGCDLHKRGFAKYFCDICNLYDDRDRPIFHCPYCNTCRMGKGLGIDFRHCMRCNACVSLDDKDHRCIPQKLQGSCPICHDTLFNSTEPLKGLRCGHVMHLSCFTEYCRGQNYTCPLCMRCMEDMSDYFSLLDQAVRMQPMPAAFQNTICNTYCQDCEKTGQCRYHFVGQKCSHCGSYNTREMGRYEQSPMAPFQGS